MYCMSRMRFGQSEAAAATQILARAQATNTEMQAVRKMYSGTGTLVPRAPYFRTEQAPVDVRGGQWQLYSCQSIPDVAVEGARRGSRIWLRLGGDLHRLAGLYGSLARGENLCCTCVCDCDV